MLVVLEGCDGAGKSTLAEFLAKLLNADIVHCTAETPNNYGFFYNIINIAKTKNIIADRFCYGQFVYQEKEDRRLSKADLRVLETHMLEADGKVILVTAPEDVIIARLASRGEVTHMPVKDILIRFDKVMSKSILPVMHFDTSGYYFT